VSKLNRDREPLIDGLARTERLARQVGDIAAALRSGHDAFHELGRAAHRFAENGQELDRVLRLLPGFYMRLGRLSIGGGAYQLGACAVKVALTGPDGNPYYTPQVGPSDNSPRCTRDNVAPLQGGDASLGPNGTPLEADRWDGQQVVAGTRDQSARHHESDFVPGHEANNGNGR